MNFTWSQLVFGSKKPINALKAIFIMAPRDMSAARFTQIIKTHLPHANIVLGIAAEEYVLGLEGQPQFKMLRYATVQKIIDKINGAKLKHSVSTLEYSQRDTKFVLEKLDFVKVLLINGSWHVVFHAKPEYYVLATKHTPYEMISPFVSEEEARSFEAKITLAAVPKKGTFTAKEMLALANQAATQSFDNGYQTGVSLGRKKGDGYTLLATGFNKVVPFQTYAWHYGASREANFSPMHDLNHYDTIHAEIDLMLTAQKQKIDLHGTTFFINLLPCPTCARMLSQTDIAEFVYANDHSEGYGLRMLEMSDKKVTRIAG